MSENSLFYEFSPECASKAQDLCHKLKLQRTETESYNPYEWMFASDENHFQGLDYETRIIYKPKKKKIETENILEDEKYQRNNNDVINSFQIGAVSVPAKPENVENCVGLSHDIQARIGQLQASLQANSVESGLAADAMDLINSTPLMQIHEVCKLLKLDDLNETSLTVVSQVLMEHHQVLSYAASFTVIQFLFKSKILNLQQAPSRVFSTTVLSVAKQFPQQMLEAVMIPTIQESIFGTAQCEVVCRIVKECLKPQQVNAFLSQLLEVSFGWTEGFIPLVQIIIDLKVPVEQSTLSSLIKRCRTESQNLKNSLKFAKLLQSTVNKYGPSFTADDIQCMQEALKENQTFLRKSIDSSVQKLIV